MGLNMLDQGWEARFDALHAAASAQTGLDDFGDCGYQEGLGLLLKALDADPPTPGTRAVAAEHQIVGVLSSRLRTQAQWAANPGYRDREIRAPLIVMGLPRTGTTALHNLLSNDPQFQGIEKWLTNTPIVRPPRDVWDAHPQYQATVKSVEQMFAATPEGMEAHGVLAHEVDECLVPMAQSFCSNWFPSHIDIPVYDAWFRQADEAPAFNRYKDMLRLIGLNDDRRWLLKNPSHVFGVEAMLAVFPDACVVQTHRDPVQSISSLVNLLSHLLKAFQGVEVDRDRRTQRELAFWAEAVRRSMATQDKYPERFVNVLQKDIRHDPIGVVKSIYVKFGLTLSDQAETAMLDWAARNSDDGGGGHKYEKIPVDDAVRAAFAGYIDRYGL